MNQVINKLCNIRFMVVIFIIFKFLAYHNKIVSAFIMGISLFICIILIIHNKEEYVLGYFFSVLEFDSFFALQNFALPSTFILALVFIYKSNGVIVLKNKIIYLFLSYWMLVSWLYYVDFSYNISYIEYAYTTFKHFGVFFNALIIFSSGINIDKLNKVIISLLISSLFFVSYGCFFGYQSLKMEGMGVGYSSQFFFFIIYLMSLLLFRLNTYKSITLIVLSIFTTLYLLKTTNTISTQNLVSILALSLFFKWKDRLFNILLVVFIFNLLGVLSIINIQDLLYNLVGSELKIKVDNIFHSLDNLNDIMLIPHSVQVRIIEIENIIHQSSIFEILFGRGVGGYFSDEYSTFPYLNEFDFSENEILSGVYFQPHNIGNLLLKVGVAIPLFFYFVVYKIKNDKERSIFIPLYIFSMMNFGFTYFPSFILGVLISGFIQNDKRACC